MRIPNRFALLLPAAALCVGLAALGCGGGGSNEAEAPAPGTPHTAATHGYPPYVVSVSDTTRLPQGVLPADTLTVFSPGVSGLQLSDSLWAIDYGWLYLFEDPPLLRTFAEMDSLAQLGRLTDESPIGVAILRVPLPATSQTEAASKAIPARPLHPPTHLQRFLEERVRLLRQYVVEDSTETP